MISRAPTGTSATISLPQLRAFCRDAFERTGMSGPAWSEYFIPLILGSSSTTPATVGIVNLIGVDTIDWGAMAAGALTLVLPVFVATLLAQRNLVRGLTAGAVKG